MTLCSVNVSTSSVGWAELMALLCVFLTIVWSGRVLKGANKMSVEALDGDIDTCIVSVYYQ